MNNIQKEQHIGVPEIQISEHVLFVIQGSLPGCIRNSVWMFQLCSCPRNAKSDEVMTIQAFPFAFWVATSHNDVLDLANVFSVPQGSHVNVQLEHRRISWWMSQEKYRVPALFAYLWSSSQFALDPLLLDVKPYWFACGIRYHVTSKQPSSKWIVLGPRWL